MVLLRSFVLLVVFFLPFVFVSANEKVGTFAIESVHLRPTLTTTEDTGGDFDLADSQFALSWEKDNSTSAHFSMGSELNRGLPVYYAVAPEDKFGFIEAYAEYKFVYGMFQVGLIPLNFGYDGVLKLNERYFNYSLINTSRVIGSSDLGVSFFTENNGYYTQLIAHNGEIDTTSDGQIWATGNWGYTNERDLNIRLSLQTGYVEKEVSLGGANTLGGVTNGSTARWRNGAFFVNWYPRNWNVVLQTFSGGLVQGEYRSRYTSNLFQVDHFFSKNFGAGLRYDEFEPNSKASGDKKTETSLVFIAKTNDSTSAFTIIGTKTNEQKNEISNDTLRVVWILNPYTR